MSYGLAAALQAALYARLTSDPELAVLVGGAVYDALPAGEVPDLYVALGPETVRDRSDQTGRGAEHEVTVTVVCRRPGFADAKAAAAAVSDALLGPVPALTRGRVVQMAFRRAVAARVGTGDARRIDLTFRARVEDD